ncbi:DUF4276 family protein [Candidatus Oscillochloris fontis]|uniref:DUF4276 family protein n=1 Tax=Candidatus Oscillochloris fontis TaxID=2496868 RepID=UPI00101C48B0|nr:DUF4276 family protein [Candidatus Oscillochloris fontis]
MIRLHFIVEGQTEETFVNRVLSHFLGQYMISVDVRRIETSRRSGKIYRGGITEYIKIKKDVTLWMKEDQNNDAFFTTMFDLYALPNDFPEFTLAKQSNDAYDRVEIMEQAFEKDISDPRFIPYIQLHEFEALILSDPRCFDWEFINHNKAISQLIEVCSQFDSPELINDNPNTAPSKRIIQLIPEYQGRKSSAGSLIAEKIGIPSIAAKCPHFAAWLKRLVALSTEIPDL